MQPERFECRSSLLCCQCLQAAEVGGGEAKMFPNSTRLRMRSPNCVPEDMPCGLATARTVAAAATSYTTYCLISPHAASPGCMHF